MAMRASWVEVGVDGKKNGFASGPKSKSGGIAVNFKVRENGSSVQSVSVHTLSDGYKNSLRVYDNRGNLIFEHITTL